MTEATANGPGSRVGEDPPEAHPRYLAQAYLIALGIAVFVVFWPLARYFFAQDDFVLLAKAAWEPAAAVADFFDRGPDHFRPLTKGAYFVVTWRVFGMHATAYHVVALLLHTFNSVMTWVLLRRMGLGELASLFATSLFALSVAFFHVVGWISCVQQLLGLAFVLIALETGLRAMVTGAVRERWISVGAYAAALCSAEQTVMTPVVLILYALLRPEPRAPRIPLRQALSATVEHWALFTVYALWILFWKTVPESGTYRFEVGSNVIVNVMAYTAWAFHYLVTLPYPMSVTEPTFYKSHLFLVTLVAWHLYRGRWRAVTFGVGYFVLMILPVLSLVEHQFYLHTYMPSLGMIYLVALAADDVFALRRIRASDLRYSILGIALIVLGVLSHQSVRRNESAVMPNSPSFRRSFVVRRALAARNAWESIGRTRDPSTAVDSIVMVYGRTTDLERAAWNSRNVVEAIGRGTMLALLYGRPGLRVEFTLESDLPRVDRSTADVFLYDDLGNCRRIDG